MQPNSSSLNFSRKEEEKQELKKFILLSTCFFLTIVAFSIIKPIKQSVFLGIVGKEYQPLTRFITMALLAPFMFLYSKLVDYLRRYKLLTTIMFFYAGLSVVFAYLLMHPVYGIANTSKSPWRLLGWGLYVYGDFFQIFVISTFWAFSNSITNPQYAKKNYGKMVAVSKLAGLLTGFLAYFTSNSTSSATKAFGGTFLPLYLLLAGIMMAGAGVTILAIKRLIPGFFLHGYEAVYEIEKKKKDQKTGIFEGIKLMVTHPYVFGIFGLVFAHEIISTIADYQMQSLVATYYQENIAKMTSFFFLYTGAFQGLGLFFSYFGTTAALKYLDVKISLIVSPIIIASLMLFLLYSPTLVTVTIVMVVLRAVNYGFNVPVREILYIPTVKDIKFKAKAWTDSFGKTFSKVAGSTFNFIYKGYGVHSMMVTGSVVSLVITVGWGLVALFVGSLYDTAIKEDKAIEQIED
ncbi:hypothetical protein KAW80_03555 [Candidatus Babeliales bacterium]|nr:hypothetical protein [Candidatus Babeliales bacterium]